MLLIRLSHVELPSGAAPDTVAPRVLEVAWNQEELNLGVTHNTSELLVVLLDETHAGPCSCVAEDTSAMHVLQLTRSRADLRSSAGEYTRELHARGTDVGHSVELSSDAPRHAGVEA